MSDTELLTRINDAIAEIHGAFGAPGDFGYETPQGVALFRLYKLRPALIERIADKKNRSGCIFPIDR